MTRMPKRKAPAKTTAAEIIEALEPVLGAHAGTIHTAIPPITLGGGADVVVFPRAPQGCVYLSAGLLPLQRRELALVTPEPAEWCAPFLSRLARAATERRLVRHGTTPLGDGPFDGVALAPLDGLREIKRYQPVDLVIGLTKGELTVCRTHGTPFVLAAMRHAGVYPYSVQGRASVVDPANVAPSPLDDPRLSADGRSALASVVYGLSHDVDGWRGRFPASDVPVLASAYDTLATWEQKPDLVLLVADVRTPEVEAMCRQYVRDVVVRHDREPIGAQSSDFYSLARALSVLDGTARDARWDRADLETVIASARSR